MKKIIVLLALIFSAVCSLSAVEVAVQNSDLTIHCSHPRLFVDDKDFKQLKKSVNSCSSKALLILHNTYLGYADECVVKDEPIEFTPNSSGKLLLVSRKVLGEIGACAYAYRFTLDRKYLQRAETILNAVCDFQTWNPRHYLDVAEMSLAVSLGYDWLYDKLDESTRSKCEDAICRLSFDQAESEEHRKKFRNRTNWGQVLNSTLAASAIAFYELNPERSQALIRRAVLDNADYIDYNYAPDGINPEGSGYWSYGTSMQIVMNSALEKVYGTDFGLSNAQGFEASALFEIATNGTSGKPFNFSDGVPGISHAELWYFASKFNNPSLIYNEMNFIEHYKGYKYKSRFGFLFIYYASKFKSSNLNPLSELTYSGQGSNPLVMTRTGWQKDDLYLGAKGGGARNNHAHLDAGSFVFDAYGVRWFEDPNAPKYADTEKALRTINGNLWNMSQESLRWKIFGYNNRQHNTITINGKDHNAMGEGIMTEVYDSPDKKGAQFNLTQLFEGQADSVSRTICIRDDSYLEIIDYVKASDSLACDVSWNFTTMADIEVLDTSIVFTNRKKKMELVAVGQDVNYYEGFVKPENIPVCLDTFYEKLKYRSAGFHTNVKEGQEMKIVITFKLLDR